MADCPINILSLCSGYGGLDLGVELALGGAARVVCGVEREAACCAILAQAMGAGLMAPFPVWSDLRTFDGRAWRGVVDLITGGYPCQPFSFAGKRRGADDPRHLWPGIARIIAEVEPGIVFFENVAGHVTLGFPAVRRELEAMGYRVTAGLFTAEEVGAPHKRERLFILGVADDPARGRGELRAAPGRDGRAEQDGGELGNADSDPRYGDAEISTEPRQPENGIPQSAGSHVADSERAEPWRGERGEQGAAGRGRNRLADGGDGVVDTGGAGLQRRERAGTLRHEGPAAPGPNGERGGAVDNATVSRHEPARGGQPRESGGRRSVLGVGCADVGNTESGGVGRIIGGRVGAGQEAHDQRKADHDVADRSDAIVDDSKGGRGDRARENNNGPVDREINTPEYTGVPLFPPGPGSGDWSRILAERPDLAPATQPRVRRVDDGSTAGLGDWLGRLDQLRALGNGVLPLTAAVAFVTLWACLEEDQQVSTGPRILIERAQAMAARRAR